MPTTTNYGFYSPPLTGVTPNVPRDTKTLADAVDTALKAEETARIAADAMVGSYRRHAAAQSFTSGTWAAVAFDTMTLDEIPWTGSTSNFWTVPTAGYYQVNASVSFATNATGVRGVRVLVNGTVVTQVTPGAGSAGGSGAAISYGGKLNAGDTVQIQGFQNSGGALALAPAVGQNVGDITRAGR